MKSIIIRSGLWSLVIMTILFVFTIIIGRYLGYDIQEIAGWAGIVLSLVFVYFGIRQYREKISGGTLSFGQGLKVGLLIVLIPAILFATVDFIYTKYINPDFYKDYYAAYMTKMKATLAPTDFAIQSKKLEAEKAMFIDNKAIQWGVMFMSVFAVGVVMTVISTFILIRKKK